MNHSSDMDAIIARLAGLAPDQLASVSQAAMQATAHYKWVPNPGPQMEAYDSKADVLLFGGQPGGGKALNIDTPIATPFGWSTMGDLRVGDAVLDERGEPCSVVAKSDVDDTEQAYRITFSDGSVIMAGARHQWVTRNRRERLRAWASSDALREQRRKTRASRGAGAKPWLAQLNSKNAKTKGLPLFGVRTTQQIFETLALAGGRLNHSVDVARPLALGQIDLLVEPYVLGAWLGDGNTDCASITGIDEEIFQAVANHYTVRARSNPISRGVLGLHGQLRSLGVLGNKHIPPAYLRASHEQRLALLQGLMDTDGHCDVRGQCEIQLIRKPLIDGVAELLSTLGIKYQMREGVAKIYGRAISAKWRLKFLTDLPAFRLARKLLRQKRAGFRGTHDVRYICKCEPIDPMPMQCIQVDSPSHCYLAGATMIPTHNSQLGLGLAFNEHKRSLIMRRQYGDLDRLVEDALRIHGSRDGFNGSPPPKLRVSRDQVIDFGAAHRVGDEQGLMGKGHDFILFDEGTQFARSQVRFIIGWLRTEDPNQRCRVVIATNPPLSAEGLWVIEDFAPWLDPRFPNPAKPGELRYFVSVEGDKDKWVEGPEPVQVGGKMMHPMSRTFIPSSVRDNPNYVRSGYEKTLDALPDSTRSILMGGFRTSFQDQPDQVIPTKWVQLAQERWTPRPPDGIPMCSIGVDASGGGHDPMVMAVRYDGWYAPFQKVQGKEIPEDRAGAYCAGQVIATRRDNALVVIDMGGGYGGPMYEHLKDNHVEVQAYRGAEKSTRRSRDGKMHFTNTRSAALWSFREALDPGQPGGSPIALPPGATIVADLTAPTFTPTPNGIKIESKEDVCERLGRSTDEGDAAMMAWFYGAKEITSALEWADAKEARKRNYHPKVIGSGRTPLSARGHR